MADALSRIELPERDTIDEILDSIPVLSVILQVEPQLVWNIHEIPEEQNKDELFRELKIYLGGGQSQATT